MSAILTTLKDKSGNTLYPVSKTNAITDSNGTDLDSLLSTIRTQINGKQNVLTFDSTPTQNSTNPVTSGGVYTALSGKADYYEYVKLSTPSAITTTTSGEKTFNIQTITGDTNTAHVYEIYGWWHVYDTGTNYGWLWSDLWGISSGASTLLMNTTSNSRCSQTTFVVPCKCTTTGLKAKLNDSANESYIVIFGYRRIK